MIDEPNFDDEKMKDSCECENNSNDNHNCDCGCNCDGDCNCDECNCENEKEHSCNCNHHEGLCKCDKKQNENEENDYLLMAKRIQADFENFRRHALEDIKKARISGQESVIEVFLPCLDTFKEAKKSINDENMLKGVEMIEQKIIDALNSLGVEKIESIGKVYNPHFHNVIAVMKDSDKENDIILDEYQAGYKFNDKVIRYAKVIVNKKED